MTIDLEYRPLTPGLGAEIHASEWFDGDSFAQLYQLWLRYKVLFVRELPVDLDALIRFSSKFGKLMRLPYITPMSNHPDIIRVLKKADEIDMGVFGGEWHSDFSFLERPPMASLLLGEDIPAVGGDTLWADLAQACSRLPTDLRRKLVGRYALHAGTPYGVRHAPETSTRFTGSIEIERDNPEADREVRHPIICRHPETGEEHLFVNPTYTIAIEGLSESESTALLDALYRHCTRPEFCCRFRWRAGSLALWDNRNTIHYAVNDYDGYRRCLYRTAIQGEAPVITAA